MSDGATQSQSRAMPRRHEMALEKLSSQAATFDGRSELLIEALEGVRFVKIERGVDPKNPRKIRAEITERGKNALERSKRGVDPYLVMTK